MTTTLKALRCGSARIAFHHGNPLDQPSEALYVSINARGVMASGLPGAIRLAAGVDFERELRSHGALLAGNAYLVGPWGLSNRGVATIVCGVTTIEPGLPPKRAYITSALAMAFDLLADAGTRSVTFPEVGTHIPGISFAGAAAILVSELTSALRRRTRLTNVVIASLHQEYLTCCHAELLRTGAEVD